MIDTSVLIDVARNVPAATDRFDRLMRAPDLVLLTPIQLAEFYVGMAPSIRLRWQRVIAALNCVAIEAHHGELSAEMRQRFRGLGIQLSVTDTLIAAVTLDYDATLLTENPRHFPALAGRVASLRD